MKTQYFARYTFPGSKGVPVDGTLCVTRKTHLTYDLVRKKVGKLYGIPPAFVRVKDGITHWTLPTMNKGGRFIGTLCNSIAGTPDLT